MAQTSVGDLVVNLDVNAVKFTEQVAYIRHQLTGTGADADKSSTIIQAAFSREEIAARRAGISVGQYKQAMRTLPAQFTDIATQLAGGQSPWLIALQQGGQIKDSFGGVRGMLVGLLSTITPATAGIAALGTAVGLLGYQYYKGYAQSEAFEQALAKSGNQANLTKEQLSSMSGVLSQATNTSKSAASDAVAQAAAMRLNADSIKSYATTVLIVSKNTGEAVGDLYKKLSSLSDDPVKALVTLGDQYNFLTPAIYEQVKALAEQGDKTAAMKVVVDELGNSQKKLGDDSPTWSKRLSDAWADVTSEINGAWVALKNYNAENGKESGKGLGVQVGGNNLPGYSMYGIQPTNGNSLAAQAAQAEVLALQQSNTKAAELVRQRQQERDREAVQARYQFDQETSAFASNAAKRKKALEDLDRVYKKANGTISDAEYRQRQKDIADRYKDPKTRTGGVKVSAGDRASDSAQGDLIALQSQLSVLKQHASVNDVISQQRKDLWQTEAQYSVLEQASQTRSLSTQEKSLLAHKNETLEYKRQLADLGDKVAAQQRLNSLADQATKFSQQQSAKRAEIDAQQRGVSGRQADRDSTMQRLQEAYAFNPQAQQKVLQEQQRTYEAEDQLRSDWLAGAKSGWAEYQDSATNVFSSVQQVSQNAYSGFSDQLTSLVTTGKASFKEFTVSILKMIADVVNRLLVAYAIQKAMGWISGASTQSFSSTGLNDGTSGVPSVPQFDIGGFTGPGDKFEPAGIVHRGEFVFTKEATSRLGVSNLYRLMRGYANGGLVGAASGMQASGKSGVNINTSVVVQNGDNQPQNDSHGDKLAKAYKQTVDNSITEGIQREIRPGGIIWQAMKTR